MNARQEQAPPSVDAGQAVDFIRKWYGNRAYYFAAINPEVRDDILSFLPSAGLEGVADWLRKMNRKRNCYFSVNAPRSSIKKQPTKSDIEDCLGFHADIDVPAPPEGTEDVDGWIEQKKEEIRASLIDHDPAPSIIIDSGGGLQAFWLFEKPYPIERDEDIVMIEAKNKQLAKDLCGDSVQDISRVMRLPGTMNWPTPKKRAKGRNKPVLATLLHADWDLRYTPHDPEFRAYVEPKASADQPRGNAKRPRRAPPDWVWRLIRNGNDAEGAHSYGGDRSDAEYAVLMQLARCGWERSEAVEIMLDRDNRISEKANEDGNPRHYVERQVKKAFDKVDAEPVENEPLESFSPTVLQGLEVPPRQWVIEDWIPAGVVTGLYGPGSAGKSLAAMQLQTAMAIRKPWLGLMPKPLRTLGVYCEDPKDELHRRQDDINRHYGCRYADLEPARWLRRFGYDNIMMQFDNKGCAELTDFARRVIADALEHRAELVIIDTVIDTFGGNQNDPGQVRQYVQACLGLIARKIGGTVLALAHPSRAGQSSGENFGGTVAWENAFRSRLSFDHERQDAKDKSARPTDPDARILTRHKANYAGRHETIRARWQSGAFATSDEYVKRPPVTDVFLALLERIIKRDEKVSPNDRATNYAPKRFVQEPGHHGYRVADFELAMTMLFQQGAIIRVPYGPASKGWVRIEPAGGLGFTYEAG